jgi:hypothetical protein
MINPELKNILDWALLWFALFVIFLLISTHVFDVCFNDCIRSIWTGLKWLWKNTVGRRRGSWRTTSLGVVSILIGLRSAWLVWVPTQTIEFNLFYVLPGSMALIILGWALIHARDHRA